MLVYLFIRYTPTYPVDKGKRAFNSPYFHVAYKLVGKKHAKTKAKDFPGGTLRKNPPANAEDGGSIPGLGRFHMPWSNSAHSY